MADDRSLK